jgi:hypothetical protein
LRKDSAHKHKEKEKAKKQKKEVKKQTPFSGGLDRE